jgi:ABC-2 type transport system ATP-binding protein
MIRTRQLVKKFGIRAAVNGIDLDIPAGQLVGLLGPNGRRQEHDDQDAHRHADADLGHAEVGGFDVVNDPLAVKRVIGYVSESGAVFEALTAQESTSSSSRRCTRSPGPRCRSASRASSLSSTSRRRTWLEAAGGLLEGHAPEGRDHGGPAAQPQGGVPRRALDGLDANAALLLKSLITSLAREGKTIVYCSHVLDVVERMCERVVIIHTGKVLEDGRVPEILQRTQTTSLEQAFNRLTSTQNLLQRAEDMARTLTR